MRNKGITLIALVITIIILLILAGITISSLTGNGILGKIEQAKEKSDESTAREIIITKIYEYQMEAKRNNKNETLEGLKEYLQNDKEIDYMDLYVHKDNLETPEVGETATHAKIKLKKYKYEYLLDKNLNIIQVDENPNNEVQVKITKQVGTSYIIINVQASSTQGNITKYEYNIDGETYSNTEPVYKIENLEPESNHTIKVTVIDEKGNKKTTTPINVKTEPRKYLYKEGEEYTELTGGWNAEYYTGDTSSVGMAKKYDNYMEMQTWGYWCAYRCVTQNKIDLGEFSKIKADIMCNWTDVSGGYEQIGIRAGNNSIVWNRVDLQNKIYELDIKIKENANVFISAGNGANAKIKSIWLEK